MQEKNIPTDEILQLFYLVSRDPMIIQVKQVHKDPFSKFIE